MGARHNGVSLSPKETDPAPQIQQAGKGGRHVGQRGCSEDAPSSLLIFRREVLALPENGKGTSEAGVPLDRKREEVDQCRNPHRCQSGDHDDDTCGGGTSDCCCDGDPHHEDRADLFSSLCDSHKLCTLCQRPVAQMVLNSMSDLVGGYRNRREGFPIEYRGCQADSFDSGVVVVSLFCWFDFDVLQVEPIEQVPGQFSTGPRIVWTRRAMLGKHPPGPELWAENDRTDDDQ